MAARRGGLGAAAAVRPGALVALALVALALRGGSLPTLPQPGGAVAGGRKILSAGTPGGGGEATYALVIDAGSSGSRVHVYKMEWEAGRALPKVTLPDKKLKVKPGLSTFKGKEKEAGAYLEPLIKFAMEHVPEAQRANTPVVLSGTAGLRMVGEASAAKILESCFLWLKANSPFKVERKKISVISGSDEGALGWLTINYLMGRLDGMPNAAEGTVGGIELGGASAQVTFQTADAADASYPLKVGGKTYQLYTHSYLGFGQEQARQKVNEQIGEGTAEDPCMNEGYEKGAGASPMGVYGGHGGVLRGTGSFEKCKAAAEAIFDKAAACPDAPCSFGGVHQPPMWKGGTSSVILFENFFHTARNVGMAPARAEVTPADFEEAGAKFCGAKWGDVSAHGAGSAYPGMEKEAEYKTCFSLAYIAAFLQRGLNMPRGTRVPVMGQVGGSDIEWSLGQGLMAVMNPGEARGVGDARGGQQSLAAAAGVQIDGGRRLVPGRGGGGGGLGSGMSATTAGVVFLAGVGVVLILVSRRRGLVQSSSRGSLAKSASFGSWLAPSASSPYTDEVEVEMGKEH